MSIKVMSQVWDHCPQKAEPLIVMLALADWCNDAGECWPAIPALAGKARITERAVFKIINRLESAGEIEITAGGGRGKRSGYRLPRYVAAETRAGSHSAQTPPKAAVKPEPRSGYRDIETLNAETLNPERGDIETLNAATLHIEEPSLGTVKEPSFIAPDGAEGGLRDDQRFFLALCQVHQTTPTAVTPASRGKFNRWSKEWRAAGVTPDEFDAAIAGYASTYKGLAGGLPSKADLDNAISAIRAGGLRTNGHNGHNGRANGKPLSAMVLEI